MMNFSKFGKYLLLNSDRLIPKPDVLVKIHQSQINVVLPKLFASQKQYVVVQSTFKMFQVLPYLKKKKFSLEKYKHVCLQNPSLNLTKEAYVEVFPTIKCSRQYFSRSQFFNNQECLLKYCQIIFNSQILIGWPQKSVGL